MLSLNVDSLLRGPPRFPNSLALQVKFGVRWIGGGLLWIPATFSTFSPTTSPRLSAIQLDFVRPAAVNRFNFACPATINRFVEP